jgi:hypothetical protein
MGPKSRLVGNTINPRAVPLPTHLVLSSSRYSGRESLGDDHSVTPQLLQSKELRLFKIKLTYILDQCPYILGSAATNCEQCEYLLISYSALRIATFR